jgi:hypothetical protein
LRCLARAQCVDSRSSVSPSAPQFQSGCRRCRRGCPRGSPRCACRCTRRGRAA